MRFSACLFALLFITTACTAEHVDSDGALLADGEDEPEVCSVDDAVTAHEAPRIATTSDEAPTCLCEQCDMCDYNFKLCMVNNELKDCAPGIPGGTPPDWRWLVQQGSYGSCADLGGVTMNGYWYYGGTKKCKLKNCSAY